MTGGNHGKTIRVGSRKSELALIQTKHVIARLQKLYPHKKFEIHTMSTMGDRVLNISLPKIGEKSLFTRDLEDALRTGGVDFVVHSLKDLPTALPVGMAIGAVLEREDARDALVLRENYKQYTLQTLPKGSVIGTSSLRRTAQIKRLYPHLSVCDIRGNLNTRLAKLDAAESKFAGIILAQAGLVRMGWMQRISQVLEPTDLLYAVGQGALAVECRSNDNEILDMLQRLVCLPTTCRILAERSFLKTLGGGCSAPVAVCSKLDGDLNDTNVNEDINISLTGAVWSLDGVTEIRDKSACFLRKLKSCDTEDEEEPPCKRARNGNGSSESGINSNSSSPDLSSGQSSPPVINDDADMEKLSSVYTLDTIIAKHVEYAKQCPVVGAAAADVQLSNNNGFNGGVSGTQQLQAAGDAVHCPIPIEVGQDFMGECPFVSNELKVSMAAAGQCPMTNKNGAVVAADEVDNAKPSTSKCPFSAMHNQQGAGDFAVSTTTKGDASHAKCPFLQKTVQMFDYADEEKPEAPKQLPVLIEDVDKLFCGLFQHACYNRELYVKSNQLGQQLAQELIEKGALAVMQCAQAEIHSKS